MDRQEVNCLEEKLREAACIGDFEATVTLIKEGVNPNAQHLINGWTALHWAAKRSQADIVKFLLENGADKNVLTKKGETPLSLASRPDVRISLGGEPGTTAASASDTSHITPHYLKYAPIDAKVDLHLKHSNIESASVQRGSKPASCDVYTQNDELVLKVRIACNVAENDFIEIEIPKQELTYYSLLRVCCEELGVAANQVSRIRKLPNTLVRKDKDVQRLKDFQELEIIIIPSASDGVSRLIPGVNGLFGSTNPIHQSSSARLITIGTPKMEDDPGIVPESLNLDLSSFRPVSRSLWFQLDFNCFNDIVHATYLELSTEIQRTVSFASYSYYCGLALWARLFQVKLMEHYESSFAHSSLRYFFTENSNYVVPKPIAIFLTLIGNFTDPIERKWCLEFTKFNDSGDFGPMDSETFLYYMTLPAPRILIESIKKELKVYKGEMKVCEGWRIPELDPDNLHFDRVFNGNVQGYRPPIPISDACAGNLYSMGITSDEFKGEETMKGLIINHQLLFHVSGLLEVSGYPMIRGLNKSGRGSVCQIAYVKSYKEEREVQINQPYFMGYNGGQCFCRLDDCLTNMVLIHRLRAERTHRLDAYPYDFQTLEEVPWNWQNHLCDIFTSYNCEEMNSWDFRATSVFSDAAMIHYLKNFR